MKKLLTSDKIYVRKSEILNAGRGVYARRDINRGEIIETCAIIEVPKYDVSNVKETTLVTYFFYFGANKERLALALGFGSMYNHSGEPNAIFKINPKEKTISFIAINNIKKDNEIIFNYNGSDKPKGKKKPLWFEA